MTKLSEHFTQEEAFFSDRATREGIDNTIPLSLLPNVVSTAARMEQVRAVLGIHSILVNSWYRCPALNALVSKSKHSAHLDGWAVDFRCPAFGTPKAIVQELSHSGVKFDQLIMEGDWVHISFDPRLRRQVMTATFVDGVAHYSVGVQ